MYKNTNSRVAFANGNPNPLSMEKKLLFKIFLYIIMYVVKKLMNAVTVHAVAMDSIDRSQIDAIKKPLVVIAVLTRPILNR